LLNQIIFIFIYSLLVYYTLIYAKRNFLLEDNIKIKKINQIS